MVFEAFWSFLLPNLVLPIPHTEEKATKAYSTNPMFWTKVDNAYEWTNYAEFDVSVSHWREMLKAVGIDTDDKVALISNNRIEWAELKYAIVEHKLFQ